MLVIESEEESLLVSVGDRIRMRNNEMLYDFETSNKAKRVDSLSFIPHSYSVLPTALSGRIHCYRTYSADH